MAGEIDTTEVIDAILPTLHADLRADLVFWSESDLIRWMDEALKRLACSSMIFVERDLSISTAGGTATYPLPSRHVVTLHVSLDTSPLRPAAQIELEARNQAYETDQGTPDHWYEDRLGMMEIGLAPVPTITQAVPIVAVLFPPELDTGKLNTLLQAPSPLKGYLTYSLLATAYGREGESEMPDLAQHCRARAQMYEQICRHYFGENTQDV